LPTFKDSTQARHPHSAQNIDFPGETYKLLEWLVCRANPKCPDSIFYCFENEIHTIKKSIPIFFHERGTKKLVGLETIFSFLNTITATIEK
jgi:hypothetical protein